MQELDGRTTQIEHFEDSLLNKSPIPAVIFDQDSAIRYANPAFESITGFSLKEMIGLKPPFPYWPESRHQEYLNTYKKNNNSHIERLFRKKNGEAFWVELVPIQISEAGTPGYYLVTMIDITERKLAEEAHRKSEEKFFKVFHSSPELIGISTLDKGEYIEINDSASRITGYTREEIIGHTSGELKIWKDEGDRARMRDTMKEKGRITNLEVDMRVKSGEIRTCLVSGELIEIGSESCIIWVCNDITERKRAEQTLKRSEAFNLALMNNTPYPMLVTNTDTSIKLVNPAFEQLTGFTNDELIGRKIPYPWWSEESRVQYLDGGPFSARDTAFSTEICHLKKNGEPFWVVVKIKPVEVESGPTLLMTTWIDITERKKAEKELTLSKEKLEELYRKEKVQKEELEEEAKARGMFIDVLAHELRTPLTPMLSSTALLKEVLKSEPKSIQSRLVANIYSSGQALASRLEELLEVARYSRGTFKLNIQPVDLKEFFRQVISRFKPSLEQTQNLLFADLSEDLPVAELDASRMEQVVINLLSNASKYSPPESRMYMKAALNGADLEVVVKDEGIGISAEEQKNIFKPYHRVTQDRKVPGLGLGLAVCKQIIEAHGGKIWVESQLGQGSTFGFSIPIKIVNVDD